MRPPLVENTLFDLTPAPPSISKEDPIFDVFDRLSKCRPESYDPARLVEAGNWLHGYQLKFGREPNAHPPDAKIVAQILTVAPWPQLQALLHDLMAERKQPGYSYAWFLTVALQRIHGISPQVQKAQRAALKVMRGGRTAPPVDPPQEEPAFNGAEIIADLARVKSFGG